MDLCAADECSSCAQGEYCPTTCGVSDYMLRYMPAVERDLERLQQQLESIANFTKETEETVVYMKDSALSAQKTSQPGSVRSIPPVDENSEVLKSCCVGIITETGFIFQICTTKNPKVCWMTSVDLNRPSLHRSSK